MQGLGAVCDNEVYSIAIILGFGRYGIIHLEMLNFLVALRVLGHRWQGKRIVIHCDNQAVVVIMNLGKTKDSILAAITRNTAMLSVANDIDLKTVHIPGKQNVVANALSRLTIHPQYTADLNHLIPYHTCLTLSPEVLNIDWST